MPSSRGTCSKRNSTPRRLPPLDRLLEHVGRGAEQGVLVVVEDLRSSDHVGDHPGGVVPDRMVSGPPGRRASRPAGYSMSTDEMVTLRARVGHELDRRDDHRQLAGDGVDRGPRSLDLAVDLVVPVERLAERADGVAHLADLDHPPVVEHRGAVGDPAHRVRRASRAGSSGPRAGSSARGRGTCAGTPRRRRRAPRRRAGRRARR